MFSFLHSPTLTSITTGKTIALTRQTFVGKVMSLLFNMLSRLVKTFLPRSKRLFISWLQSPSAVILEPRKIVSHCFHCFPIYLPWSDGTGCHDLSFLNGLQSGGCKELDTTEWWNSSNRLHTHGSIFWKGQERGWSREETRVKKEVDASAHPRVHTPALGSDGPATSPASSLKGCGPGHLPSSARQLSYNPWRL